MATEQQVVATATDGGATPAQTTQTATPDAGGEKPTTPPAEAAQPSKSEWVDYRKEQRDTQKLLKDVLARLDSKPAEPEKPKAKTAPTADDSSADIRAELAEMKARTTFQDALDEVDVPLNKAQRSVIQKLFLADKPPEAAEWLKGTLASLGIDKPAAAPAAVVQAAKPPPPQAQTRSDTGPPGATHGEVDLSNISREKLQSMTKEQRMELYRQRDVRQGGGNHNPFTKQISFGK